MDFTNPVHPQPDVSARRGRWSGPDHVAFCAVSVGLTGAEEVAE